MPYEPPKPNPRLMLLVLALGLPAEIGLFALFFRQDWVKRAFSTKDYKDSIAPSMIVGGLLFVAIETVGIVLSHVARPTLAFGVAGAIVSLVSLALCKNENIRFYIVFGFLIWFVQILALWLWVLGGSQGNAPMVHDRL
jgi:hypothetical protein